MSLPQIVHGDTTLAFQRGPKGFACGLRVRVNDNLATSGLRERVVEGQDLIISFTMPMLKMGDDFEDWAAFAAYALAGGEFKFYPDAAETDYYNCVSLDEAFDYMYVAPQVYAAAFRFLIVPDEQAPADPGAVMAAFYGVTV